MFGLFVLLGCFPSPRIFWSSQPPLGVFITKGIGDLCQSARPPPMRLIGELLLMPDPLGGALQQESSLDSWTAQFHPYWFRQGVFVILFVLLPPEELLGLTQALAKLGMIYFPSIRMISSDPQTGGVGQKSVKIWLHLSSTGLYYWYNICSVLKEEKI